MFRAIGLMLCAALLALAADVSGTWRFTVETDQGSGNPTFTLKQSDEKLTGTYTGLFGTADVTGSVKGNQIEIQMNPDVQGQKVAIKYSGTVESQTSMKGTVDFGGMGTGKWTATKQ